MLGTEDLPTGDRVRFNTLWVLDHLLGTARVDRVLSRSRARLLARVDARMQAKGKGVLRPVEKRRDLSAAEFHERYLATNTPVVFEGAALDWPCMAWTPTELARRYPDQPVILIKAGPEDLDAPDYEPGTTTFAEVVRDMGVGGLKYARFNPLLHERPELLAEVDTDWLQARRNRWVAASQYQLFMGGSGTATLMHGAIANNLFLQIHGRKRWLVYPTSYNAVLRPPVVRAPYFFSELNPSTAEDGALSALDHLDGWQVDLQPGDVLFNPSFFWHHVTNLTDTVGVGFRWTAPYNVLSASPIQGLLTLLATNPSVFEVQKNRVNFPKIFNATRC